MEVYMEKQDIIVIGAGAAGIMAAITAARNHAKVILLEHTDRIGKKLLATGNGRCNLTNFVQDASCYRSENQSFPMRIIEQFDEQKVLKFFGEIGIYTKDKNGYVYPYSEQASVVLDLLTQELERLNVLIQYDVSVTNIKKSGERYIVLTDKGSFQCDRIILATGSKAAPKTGSDGSGYDLAKMLGHHIIRPLPALVQLRCEGDYFKSLAGIRCEAKLCLQIDGKEIISNQGELQLTDYGISGIPTFQISRYAVRALEQAKQVIVRIDFMPVQRKEDILSFLYLQIKRAPHKYMEDILIGLLHKKLVPVLLKTAGIQQKTLSKNATENQLNRLLSVMKAFEVKVKSYNSFEQAQVCSGGVDTKELSAHNLESKKAAGIYFAGELIDVDGICGGYNLQWAWSSGYVAGSYASKN